MRGFMGYALEPVLDSFERETTAREIFCNSFFQRGIVL